MTTENPTPNQIRRDRWVAESRAEAEQQRLAREQWMSNAFDISVEDAQALTKLIKDGLEDIFDRVHGVAQLILEARNRRAWQALGYSTWEQYVKKEFALSRSRSYQLIDQALVVTSLREAADSVIGALDRRLPTPTIEVTPGPTPINISAREVQRLKPQIPEAQAEVARLVSEGTHPAQAINEVVEQFGSPPQGVPALVEPAETPPKVTRLKASDIHTGFLAINLKPQRSKPRAGDEPLGPPEPLIRPDGHEDRARKFRDAIVALYDLANEVYALSASNEECIDNLRLVADDGCELADGGIYQDHISTLNQIIVILGW
jgi:hypothetical protein